MARDCLITSLPTVHIQSAIERLIETGRVQFGSDDESLFSKLEAEGKVGHFEVFVFPAGSKAGDRFPPNVVCMSGKLDAIGTESDPGLRPATTLEEKTGDTPSKIYWTLRATVRIGDFKTADGSGHQRTPRRTMRSSYEP